MTDLVTIVSKHVTLQEGRKALKGNCPFHPDQSGSFMVSPEKTSSNASAAAKKAAPQNFFY